MTEALIYLFPEKPIKNLDFMDVHYYCSQVYMESTMYCWERLRGLKVAWDFVGRPVRREALLACLMDLKSCNVTLTAFCHKYGVDKEFIFMLDELAGELYEIVEASPSHSDCFNIPMNTLLYTELKSFVLRVSR